MTSEVEAEFIAKTRAYGAKRSSLLITIPKPVAEYLSLKQGDLVHVRIIKLKKKAEK
jgi:hypothetical protein